MSYKGSVLRGEKYAFTFDVATMKKLGGSIHEDYLIFLESEKKIIKEKKKNGN